MTTGATTAPYRNPKGHVLGAPWTFVLPDAAPDRVVVLGRPSAAAREALARFAPLEVRAVGDTADLADGSAGVVAVLGRRAAGRLRRQRELHAEAVRLLRPGGALYVDGPAPRAAGGTVLPLAVTPVVGEPRTVAPAGDEAVRRQLARRGLSSPVVEPERLEAAARRLARGRLARLGWRRATLVTSDGLVDPGAPPAWLLAMAGAEGVDLEGMRWALSAAGRYRSRKVLVFLFDPGADAPRFVVKLPRHPEEGGRLEREAAALAAVAGAGLPDAVDVPRLAFSGVVGRERLPVLGQVALPGAPLRSRLAGGPEDPVRTTLLQWVTELGTATAAPAAPGEVAARLEPLLERFVRTGRPSDEERSVLRDAVAALAAAPGLPLVLEHGDLGVWNVLVRLDGKPAVLDWEAAERRGMPLWDLLYLLRSFAASTSGGGSDRSRAVVDLLEGRPPQGDVLAGVVGRYASALRLDPAVLVPLLLTCWMHRAQKEASRREDGPYRRLLRHCVEHRHSLRVGTATDGLWRSA
jgi:hypothetical protein